MSVFELAERFSYFGMLSILLYYIYFATKDGGLGLDTAVAAGLVGAYSGGIYLASVGGAWVADRLLGSSRTLALGALMVLAGHVCLALLPGLGGLLVGMLLVALGSGATKANTASIVGGLYEPRDERRIIGFTIFYLSINLGALLGGLAVAFLQQTFGFHVGFGAAALGMLIGLIVLFPARRALPESARRAPAPANSRDVIRAVVVVAVLAIVLAVLFISGTVTLGQVSIVVAIIGAVAAIAYILFMRASEKVSREEFNSVLRYLPIFLASTLFTALWIQLYTAVAVHAEARSDRFIFGFELPPATAISFGAIFAIVFTPAINAMWRRLGIRQPGTAAKYAIAFLVISLGFAVMALWSIDEQQMIPIALMLGVVGAFYLADLIGSPAGLSYATLSAPRAFTTQMVALHLLSYAIGSALAGVVGATYTPASANSYFTVVTIAALVIAAALVLTRRWTVDSKVADQKPAAV